MRSNWVSGRVLISFIVGVAAGAAAATVAIEEVESAKIEREYEAARATDPWTPEKIYALPNCDVKGHSFPCRQDLATGNTKEGDWLVSRATEHGEQYYYAYNPKTGQQRFGRGDFVGP